MPHEIPGPGIEKRREGVTGTYTNAQEFDVALTEFIKGGKTKIYDRYSYPELVDREAEVKKAIGLERGEVILYNSGMAAINESLYANLRPGDVLLYDPNTYLQIPELAKDYSERGVKCISVNFGEKEALEQAIDIYKPTVVMGEVVSNAASGMRAVDTQSLMQKIERTNEEYRHLGFKDLLSRRLAREAFFDGTEERKVELLQRFEKTAKEIDQKKNYFPLRELISHLEEEGSIAKEDRENNLRLMKTVIDSAWAQKREKPITLILDNTLPTEAGHEFVKQVEGASFPVVVAESGTKFFAKDEVTLGVVYGNDPGTLLNLRLQRMRTGAALSPAAEALVPKVSKESLQEGEKNLENTKMLAETLERLVGSLGLKAVNYPNLPSHPDYEYASKEYPKGASPLLYAECENARETAEKIEAAMKDVGLGDQVKYSVSFGFNDIRLLFVSSSEPTVLRIAGGRQSSEEMLKIADALLAAGQNDK